MSLDLLEVGFCHAAEPNHDPITLIGANAVHQWVVGRHDVSKAIN
jgi:hypothetical protein